MVWEEVQVFRIWVWVWVGGVWGIPSLKAVVIFSLFFGSRTVVIFQHFFALLDSEVYVLIACLLAQERAGRKLVSYIYCGYAPKR